MHVSFYIIFFSIICGLMAEGLQQNATIEIHCKTGKGMDGICSRREDCNYSTKNIDLTLYEPRGFKRYHNNAVQNVYVNVKLLKKYCTDYNIAFNKKICYLDDVCCPPQYIKKIEEPKVEDTDFTFDDDD